MKFIVQDLPGTVEQGRKALPSDLEGRVEFVAHDFFTGQTQKGPSFYLFRWIMHNWSSPYCVKVGTFETSKFWGASRKQTHVDTD